MKDLSEMTTEEHRELWDATPEYRKNIIAHNILEFTRKLFEQPGEWERFYAWREQYYKDHPEWAAGANS